jgi:hypothetical protein
MSKKDLAVSTVFNDLLAFVESRQKETVTTGPCKLCNSKLLAAAEAQYERTKNSAAVHRWLVEKGEDISYVAVNNHINFHYNAQQDERNIYNLASKLSGWSKMSRSDEAMFNRYITMLDMEATSLMAENVNLNLEQRRKNNETVIKLAQLIGYFKDQLHKLNAEKRPVQIFVDTLHNIIKVKLEDCKNPEVQQALKDVVDKLTKDVDMAAPKGLKEIDNDD